MNSTLLNNWKTTAAGLLSGYLAIVGPVTAYLATTSNPKATQICGALTLAGVIARAWLGMIQKDAGTTPALVPGSATPQLVPSHEVPDSASAIPVKEGSGTVPTSTFPNK